MSFNIFFKPISFQWSLLYPLRKHQETIHRFYDVFRVYKIRTLGRYGLISNKNSAI